jgi:hypothetical protein
VKLIDFIPSKSVLIILTVKYAMIVEKEQKTKSFYMTLEKEMKLKLKKNEKSGWIS